MSIIVETDRTHFQRARFRQKNSKIYSHRSKILAFPVSAAILISGCASAWSLLCSKWSKSLMSASDVDACVTIFRAPINSDRCILRPLFHIQRKSPIWFGLTPESEIFNDAKPSWKVLIFDKRLLLTSASPNQNNKEDNEWTSAAEHHQRLNFPLSAALMMMSFQPLTPAWFQKSTLCRLLKQL